MAKFFISYSQRDRQFVWRLRRDILKIDNSHELFLDDINLHAGANLKLTLRNMITWCDHFILVMSGHAINSKWVKYELAEARKNELETGEKKVFPIRIDNCDLPRSLAEYLVADFSDEDNFTAAFYKLMNGISQRPTHFEIRHRIVHDPETGYLFSIWVDALPEFMKTIDFVEYRFDNEFDYRLKYNAKIIDGAVHVETSGTSKFGVYDLWTSESITVFVCLYLKSTKVIYLTKYIEAGAAAKLALDLLNQLLDSNFTILFAWWISRKVCRCSNC